MMLVNYLTWQFIREGNLGFNVTCTAFFDTLVQVSTD
jgi:hypothetical protein